MTLEQLKIFTEVASSQSLREASKKLAKAQPAVSVSLKNLEINLGIKLFSRSEYRMKLTAHGEALLGKAKEILAHSEEMQQMAQKLNLGQDPVIRLAIDSLYPSELLDKLVVFFQSKFIHSSLDISLEVLGGVEEKIIEKKAHFGITPFILSTSNFITEELLTIQLMPVGLKKVFPTSKPSAKKLLSVPQLLVKDSAIDQKYQFGQIDESFKWRVSHYETKKNLILKGLGWGNLSENSIKKELKQKKLQVFNLDYLKPQKLTLYLTRLRHLQITPTMEATWLELIKQARQ